MKLAGRPSETISGSEEPPVSKLASSSRYDAIKPARSHLRFPGRHARAAAPREHQQQPIILTRVVPRAPADVEGEDPRQKAIRRVQQTSRQNQQQRDVQRENLVLFETFARAIGPVNRGHVMRIIEQKRQEIKAHRPRVRMRRRQIRRHQQQQRGPRSTPDDQVQRWPVDPGRRPRRRCPARFPERCPDLTSPCPPPAREVVAGPSRLFVVALNPNPLPPVRPVYFGGCRPAALPAVRMLKASLRDTVVSCPARWE